LQAISLTLHVNYSDTHLTLAA